MDVPEIQQRLGRPGALTQGDAHEAQLRSRSKWLKNLPEMIIRLPTVVCQPQAVRERILWRLGVFNFIRIPRPTRLLSHVLYFYVLDQTALHELERKPQAATPFKDGLELCLRVLGGRIEGACEITMGWVLIEMVFVILNIFYDLV